MKVLMWHCHNPVQRNDRSYHVTQADGEREKVTNQAHTGVSCMLCSRCVTSRGNVECLKPKNIRTYSTTWQLVRGSSKSHR